MIIITCTYFEKINIIGQCSFFIYDTCAMFINRSIIKWCTECCILESALKTLLTWSTHIYTCIYTCISTDYVTCTWKAGRRKRLCSKWSCDRYSFFYFLYLDPIPWTSIAILHAHIYILTVELNCSLQTNFYIRGCSFFSRCHVWTRLSSLYNINGLSMSSGWCTWMKSFKYWFLILRDVSKYYHCTRFIPRSMRDKISLLRTSVWWMSWEIELRCNKTVF